MKLTLLSLFGALFFTIILLFLPLTGIPSYESSMAVNIFILLFFIYLFPKLKRIHIIEDYAETISGVCLTLFSIPLIILIISGFFKGFCPGHDGFVFYFVINAPLLFLLSSIGLVYYKIRIKPYMTSLFFLLMILLSLSVNFYELIFTPKVKFYSILLGFFPGPIYDEDVWPDRILFLHKSASIIISSFIWLLLYKRNIFRTLFAVLLIIPSIIIANSLGPYYLSEKRFTDSLGAVYNTKHFEILYPPDQQWSGYIDIIAGLHEYYYEELQRELRTETDIRIRSYIFRDEDEKKELTGAGRTQIAKPWLREIYLTPVSVTDSKLKHEISHIIIGSLIDSPLGLYGKLNGLIPNMAVVEGISVSLEPETNIMTLYDKAAVLLKKDKLTSFENLFNAGRFYSKSGSVSYSASGAFIKYLIQKYGIDHLKRILKNEDFADVYGKKISEVEKEYRNFLQNIEITPQKEYYSSVLYNAKGLIEKRCPHEIANIKKRIISHNRKSNSTAAYETTRILSGLCLSDSEIIAETAKALIGIRKFDEAERFLSENISKAENSYYLNLFYDMLSDIYIYKSEIEKSRKITEDQLLMIPDSDIRRNFEIKNYLHKNNKTDFIKKFFTIEKVPATKAGILTESLLTLSEPSAKYLFGRLLFNAMDHENCAKYLMEFIIDSVRDNNIPRSLIMEAANMLLITSIFSKNYDIAEKTIGIIDSLPENYLKDYDYHMRRYNHIKKFYLYIKKEG